MKRLVIRLSQCNYQLSESKVDKLSMVGVNGKKFPDIRAHLEKNIASVYKNFDISWVVSLYYPTLLISLSSFEEFPKDGLIDPEACTCPAFPLV